MSIPAVGFAFTLRLPATQKWLLVCLADYADEWGDSIFASLEELTDRTSLSRATLQRTFRELLREGVILRVANSTPSSPPFYRIVMPEPEPGTMPRRDRDCPNALRAAVKYAFAQTCEYCHGVGTSDKGPDGHRWTIDRLVPGQSGGRYVPENVTLACRFCNTKKRTGNAPIGTRSLADVTRAVGHQNEAPVLPDTEPRPDAPGVAGCDLGGLTLRPDPLSDPVTDPLEEQAGAAPRAPRHATPETPSYNIGVITKIAHEVFDLIGASHEDVPESIKSFCARRRIAYDSTVVRAAIESATWQRRRKASGA